jgi:hypothetical protein
VDVVTGDGCYIVLAQRDRFDALTREVHRVLRPHGCFAIRVFLRPDEREPLEAIAAALAAGAIGSVHALKLRLLAALHDDDGVCLGDVWSVWSTMPRPPAHLAGRRGWTAGEIAGVEAYRGLDVRYVLPTAAAFRAAVAPYFVERSCGHASAEHGAYCPTFVLAARADARA